MKRVETWLNEEQFKMFCKAVEKRGTTPYALTKHLIIQFLTGERRKEETMVTLAFWFFTYIMAVATLVLVVLS